MRLVIVVPALINCEKHLEMVRVQSLLRDRLRPHGSKSLQVHSCVVFDAVESGLMDRALEFPFSIKLFGVHLYPHGGPPIGIRRPFEQGLKAIARVFDSSEPTWLLRVIQDVFIDDAATLIRSLEELSLRHGAFLAGEFAGCANIHPFLDQLRIPRAPFYPYIQGELMFAPLEVWLRHYPRLPPGITHFCDDSVLSRMVTHAGGELVRLPCCWHHRHDCSAEESRATYDRHLREIRLAREEDIVMSGASDEGHP